MFIADCPCHLAHIASSNFHDAFSEYIGLNVEDVMVDLSHWFDKRAKRKGKLKEDSEFCRSGYNSYFKVFYGWLGKKVEKSILLPSKVRQISSISKTDLNDPENFMDTQDIYLRVQTKNMLKKFLDQSDISQDQYKEFRDAARYYFESAF